MVEVHNSDVDAIPAPFRLAQQWVGIGKHCCVPMVTSHTSLALPNNVLGLVSIADETMKTKTCGLLWSKSDI
jgi:hypothetical protein